MPLVERRSTLVIVSLIVSLAIIAVLQYRWVSEMSRSQREALRATLDDGARQFTIELDREIGRAFNCFQRPPEESWNCWSANALEPRIVRATYIFEDEAVKRFDPERGEYVEADWPEALEQARGRRRGPVEPRQLRMLGDKLVMLVPQPPGPPRRDEFSDEPPPLFREDGPGPPRRARGQMRFGLVEYDFDAIRTLLLPKLSEMHLRNMDVAVFRAGDRLAPIYSTANIQRFAKPDVVHPFPPPNDERPVLWNIAVVHRAGSLDAAVRGARQRNFITSGAVLLLLAMSVVLLVISTRRAQTLARQQLDFVAGISHELNTPLAAIRSAAENLADGVVRDDEQLRRYGTMITREGRRLSGMVGKVLTYAGLESGTRWRQEPVDIGQLVARIAQDCRWMVDERGGSISYDTDGVPPVRGDGEALRRAVQNVVENAVKYGGTPPVIEIRASQRKRKVIISIEDNGAGFGERDLPHVFEPFYRGQLVVARAVPGSGLGLSLVRRIVEGHGGRAFVSNRAGGGAVVTIELPGAA